MNQKKSDVEKRIKVKVTNDFIADEKTLNAKTFKKSENNVQSILHRRVIYKFFKNDHRN